MAGFLSGILAPLAQAAGQGYLGYGEDKQDALKQAALKVQQDRQAKQDALAEALGGAQMGHLKAETDALVNPAESWGDFETVVQNGVPTVVQRSNRGNVKSVGPAVPKVPQTLQPGEAVLQADGSYKVPVPKEAPAPQIVQGTDSDGNPVAYRVNPRGGPAELVPGFQGKNGMGGKSTAAIKKAVSDNMGQMTVLDNAIALLEKTPSATGFSRGGAGIFPKFGDAIDQRVDPSGVDARAALSNIASLKMHDRSGAAVTASEFPRLAPFIPSVQDLPDVAIKKLKQLKQELGVETSVLQANGIPQNIPSGSTSLPKSSGAPMLSAADRWEQLVSQGMNKAMATALVQKQYGGQP